MTHLSKMEGVTIAEVRDLLDKGYVLVSPKGLHGLVGDQLSMKGFKVAFVDPSVLN